MIMPTADLSCVGQDSSTAEDFAPICARAPWRASSSQELFQVAGKDYCGFFSAELQDYLFGLELDQYLESGGAKQRVLRKGLAATIAQSENFDKRMSAVLERVASSRSQNVITASIDLLVLLADRVVPMALKTALAETVRDENAAFVLSSVAARRGSWLTRILLKSRHEAVREGAVEAVATRPSLESRPVLCRVSQQDPSASIQARAKELVQENS